jgi:UDP-N-acetylmuramoyl-L-alanyl-D-glutamate--2,6-diaminopimelate ligase
VSSHSLAQSRVHGLDFDVATFTNLTQDHLDFHGSMEEYFRSKKILFDGLSPSSYAVTNADDRNGPKIVDGTMAQKITYGTVSTADLRTMDIRLDVHGTWFSIFDGTTVRNVQSTLTGRFNIANISAAYATGVALGLPPENIIAGIADLKSVRGRFEQIASPQGWTAVVDYAHTPDALENCLQTIHDILPQHRASKVITVFGCGGNRDRGKRPLMGKIAAELSDITIITSDNPRKEDPEAIIDEIKSGVMAGKVVYVEVDRRNAIHQALKLAREGDVVLIAGKGHENYQVVGEAKVHFDDREEVERYIHTVQ